MTAATGARARAAIRTGYSVAAVALVAAGIVVWLSSPLPLKERAGYFAAAGALAGIAVTQFINAVNARAVFLSDQQAAVAEVRAKLRAYEQAIPPYTEAQYVMADARCAYEHDPTPGLAEAFTRATAATDDPWKQLCLTYAELISAVETAVDRTTGDVRAALVALKRFLVGGPDPTGPQSPPPELTKPLDLITG